MPSLWRMFRKGNHVGAFGPVTEEMVDYFRRYYHRHEPALVNIQNVRDQFTEDMMNHRPVWEDAFQDITPCFKDLWLEWINPVQGIHVAVAVHRSGLEEADGTGIVPPDGSHLLVVFYMLVESNAVACIVGRVTMYIDRLGIPVDGACGVVGQEDKMHTLIGLMTCACEALSIMNTRGTHIEPPFPAAPAGIVKPKRYASSTWHTIHVPKLAREPQGLTGGPVVERREHMVRAHRADYRKGGGLFGRLHELIWVPEHKRGNPELGTVKQSYRVERPKERE